MFKASIALVLIAFAALAYGWVADNDAILYGSIGASILAGLLLLRATLADRKAGYPEPAGRDRPESPAREPREPKPLRKTEPDYPSPSRSRRTGDRAGSGELTRQLDVSAGDDDDFLGADSEQATPFRPQGRRRERLPSIPEGAAWAVDNDQDDEDESGLEAGGRRAGSPPYAGDLDQDSDQPLPAAPSSSGASAADDFRSRLAAVLGSTGEESPPPPVPVRRGRGAAPKPVPLEDEEDDDEAPAAAAQRTMRPAPRPAAEAEPQPATPKRRGRKKASESVIPAETVPEVPGSTDEPEPEWVHIDDVPRVSRVTQPGGGFARPDVPEEVTHYRPRRPAVTSSPPEPAAEEPGKPPAARKRRSSAAVPESKVRSVSPKPSSREGSGLTRVTPAEKTRSKPAKERDPDAPPPRRGRPPKAKP